MEDKSLLRVENIHSGYGKMEILHGVTMEIKKSEIVAIIGPNGAGKSTTFKTIVGLLPPKTGRIVFKNEDITGIRPNTVIAKGLSYIPQGRVVFSQMSVLENLEMGAYMEKEKENIAKALERVFQLFPILKERRMQKAGTMSGGEQQMLAMARGLMLNPECVLLDEPSLGLSPKFINIIFEKIVEMKEAGITMMIVEQNAKRVLEIADRGYVLELGENRFYGTGRELLENEEVRRLYLGG